MADPFNPPPGVSRLTALTAWISSATAGIAERLTTARKIDGAAFDGTADIRTLSSNMVGPIDYVSGEYFYCNSAGASGTSTLVNNRASATRWDVVEAITITRLWCEVTTVGEAGSVFRLGVWADDGAGKPGALVVDGGTVAGDSTGVKEVTVSQALPVGTYWVGGAVQSAATTPPTMRVVSTSSIQHHYPLGTSLPSSNTQAVAWTHSSQSGAFGTFVPGAIPGGVSARIGFKVA